MAAIATSWFVFLRFWLMEEAGDWWFPNMYEDLWSPGERGFRSVLKTLISNPYYTLSHVLVEKKLYYLLHLLVPVMFVPARRWYLWAAFVPGAVITLLVTDYDPPIMFTFQYVMYWAPFLFVAVVLFLAEAARRVDFGPQRAQAALVAVSLASLVLSYNYGAFAAREKSFRSGYHTISFTFSEAEKQRYADLRELITHLPPKASVAATERIGAHVSARRLFYSMRRGTHGADYGAVEKRTAGSDDEAERVRDLDALVSRVETFLVDEYNRGGVTAQAKARMHTALDSLRGMRKRIGPGKAA